ncbi:MAG: hypothetical protein PHX43_07700 [Alphaproteobacteria bacterium]|nr:hypothetical protein [Alphaproteobacteria bacterium]
MVLTTRGALPSEYGWKARKRILPAETCARHIYFGLVENFDNIPGKLRNHGATKIYTGAEAHSFAVSFYAGLENKNRNFDTDVSRQLTEAWNSFYSDPNRDAGKLKPYMDDLFHDGLLIKSRILDPFLKQPTTMNTAVEKANIGSGHEVLVIGGKKEVSVAAVRALGNKKIVINFTHSDAAQLIETEAAIKGIANYDKIKAELRFMPVDEAVNSALFKSNAVLVCRPSGDEDTNVALCTAWVTRCKNQPDGEAKIIHLRRADLEASPIWKALDSEQHGFIPYSIIEDETRLKYAFINSVADKAREAIWEMSTGRMRGDRVNGILFDKDTLMLEYRYARRPLGAAANRPNTQQNTSTSQAAQVCAF